LLDFKNRNKIDSEYIIVLNRTFLTQKSVHLVFPFTKEKSELDAFISTLNWINSFVSNTSYTTVDPRWRSKLTVLIFDWKKSTETLVKRRSNNTIIIIIIIVRFRTIILHTKTTTTCTIAPGPIAVRSNYYTVGPLRSVNRRTILRNNNDVFILKNT